MAYVFRLGKYVYELPVKDEFLFITKEAGPWRINKVKKALLRMPFEEQRKLYQMLDEEPEVKAFAMQHANKLVRWELTHPRMMMAVSPLYKLIHRIWARCKVV